MKTSKTILLGVFLIFASCNKNYEAVKEPWINKPVSQWPDFALTNEISFQDTTYRDFANGFLVTTGFDTIGVSCKHLFMVFQKHLGINNIDLGENFIYWKMYPKNNTQIVTKVKKLINKNPKENIGQFNSLKTRDWLILEIEKNPDIYPLKIRYAPIKTDETVYAVGWGMKQKDNRQPALIKLRCIKYLGDYYYLRPLESTTQAHGRSGSPVIDKNGYLVGIVSGQEGNMAVIGSVSYLRKLFDDYGVLYSKPK